MDGILIRREREDERRKVEELVRDSFWNVYRPGCLEHFVLHELRNDPDFIPELDLVMEKDGEIIGQIVFVRASIYSKDGKTHGIATFGPVSIKKEFRGKGLGKYLVDHALQKAIELKIDAVCIEGNIDFYSKCGLRFGREYGLTYHGLPEGMDDSFFLCKELTPGFFERVNGEYRTPSGYFVDEEKAEEFDKIFPEKEKLVLPGQLC